jgi:hypothetical protein
MVRRAAADWKLSASSNVGTKLPPPPMPRLALSITDFCQAHGISEAFFYKLKKGGEGPRMMKVGTRTLITFEAASDWRREREAASATTEVQAKAVAPSSAIPPAQSMKHDAKARSFVAEAPSRSNEPTLRRRSG